MRRTGGWHLRFQRRFTIFKGVRLNVGRRGFGVTVGGRLARFGVTSQGKLYQSVSIPGTRVSMRRTVGSVGQLPVLSSQRPRLITPVMVVMAVLALMLLLAALTAGK